MASESKTGISQKEYLKKYLSNSNDEKKKKKKRKVLSSSTIIKRSQIIDDDVDLKNMRVLNDDEVELYQLDEDAPQIAGIVDERPVEVQAMEYYNTKRWKVFGTNEDGELTIKDNYETSGKDGNLNLPDSNLNNSSNVKTERKKVQDNDSDLEPPRKHKNRNDSDEDLSPPRSAHSKSKSFKHRSGYDLDLSPPRKNKRHLIKSENDSDLSPLRRSNKHSKDKSRQGSDSDMSPLRKSNKYSKRSSSDSDSTPVGRSNKCNDKKSRDEDSDLSPPRKSDKTTKTKSRQFRDSDFSPPRKGKSYSMKRNHESDMTGHPDRHNNSKDRRNRRVDSSDSPRRGYRDSNDYKVGRKYDRQDRVENYYRKENKKNEELIRDNSSKKHRDYDDSEMSSKHKENKMHKTLDGKRAGLQDARQLKQELAEFKDREEKMFSKMGSDLSGKGAAAVMRDRKTGLKRDLDRERKEAMELAEKSAKDNEKYITWGKGVKQTEEAAERLANAAHEMSKPLARYADDDDLDRHLKAQEREGDPMLDYIRNKQRDSIALTEKKPLYSGTYLPNRFGIRPGYRWDGVDRSNGYEKQWFTAQNNRRARDEEAYKWSVSDM